MTHRLILRFSLALCLIGPAAYGAGSPKSGEKPSPSVSPTSKREEAARRAFRAKKFDKVANLLLSYSNDISKPARLMLAESLHNLKKYDDEIRVLELNLKDDSDDYLTYARMAKAYIELKKNDDAINSFRQAIRKNRKYLPAYEDLLYLFETTNNYYEARLILKDMVKVFGARKEYLHKMCRIDSLDGYIDSAIKVCLEAIFTDTAYPDSYVYLANNYRDSGKQTKAQKAYSDAAKKFPDSEFVQSAAGRFFSEKENHHAAFRYFRKASKADPKSVRALLGLAQSALEIGEYKVSLDTFISACNLDKSIAPEFRQAATQLRVKQIYKWSGDFEAKSNLCRLNNP